MWDFLLGVMVTGGATAVTFLGLMWIFSAFVSAQTHGSVQGALMGIQLAVPSAALWLAIRWRAKHRLLPTTWLWSEVVVGLLLCGGFCLFVIGTTAMSDPSW